MAKSIKPVVEALTKYVAAAQKLSNMKNNRSKFTVDEIANAARSAKGWREVFDGELEKAINA